AGEATLFQKAQQRADAGEPTAERTRACAVIAPPCQERAQIRRPKCRDVGKAGRAAAMAGQELQELARVALVGLDGERRRPSLAGERSEPVGAGRGEVGPGGNEEFLHRIPDPNHSICGTIQLSLSEAEGQRPESQWASRRDRSRWPSSAHRTACVARCGSRPTPASRWRWPITDRSTTSKATASTSSTSGPRRTWSWCASARSRTAPRLKRSLARRCSSTARRCPTNSPRTNTTTPT